MAKSNDWGGPNRQWVIAEHPVTTLEARHFEYREAPVAEPGPGEVLLKTHLLNIAPVMRMYMMQGGAAGEAPLEIGDLIHGRGVAEVIASNHAGFAPGEFVQGQLGWQTWKVSRMTDAEKFRPPEAARPAHTPRTDGVRHDWILCLLWLFRPRATQAG